MMDGKLGNYTIKSFCACTISKNECVDIKEDKFGELAFKDQTIVNYI
jgi:hypothetical protein